VGAAEFVSRIGPLLRHVHLKDVAARGGHDTVPLGAGCVGIDALIRQMKKQNYAGYWSWEDEPEDRNPLAIAAEMRKYIESRI
jgi:sugar phosphate isomerase/epimerase